MSYTKIGFDAGLMSLRGTHVAIFDYATHLQKILGKESVIFYDRSSELLQPEVFHKFKSEFQLIPYDQFQEIQGLVDRSSIDAMYLIKSGERDDYSVPNIPNLIHAVFPQRVEEVHGHVYAFVSRWLSDECSNMKIPYVPHMITIPLDGASLRNQLGIPLNANVFGCYGGSDSFNIGFAKKVVEDVLLRGPSTHFLFMNIDRFIDHPRAIFLPGNPSQIYKSSFINSCDAMLHARGIGESFGLACGEFSVHNKPVITYSLSPQRSHIDILGDKAMLYKGPKDLSEILLGFNRTSSQSQNWDCYSKNFSPLAVMSKFNSVFLESDTNQGLNIDVGLLDKAYIQGNRFRKKIRSLSRKLYL